jgi:hypothetical protein
MKLFLKPDFSGFFLYLHIAFAHKKSSNQNIWIPARKKERNDFLSK